MYGLLVLEVNPQVTKWALPRGGIVSSLSICAVSWKGVPLVPTFGWLAPLGTAYTLSEPHCVNLRRYPDNSSLWQPR